jgi:predicted ABC-type ATPase
MFKKTVWIMQGVSGAGKSHLSDLPTVFTVSADHFFMCEGEYQFDASKLGEAHSQCLRRFVKAINNEADFIVVDNTNTTPTNTTPVEVAPYYALASAYGYDVVIKYISCEDLNVAAARNRHGVPLKTIEQQAKRIENFAKHMPPYWNRETVEVK